MAKLYFKYGAMGSSKTAQALITKFNYEERGMSVWLIKPALDNRDGALTIRSRIGLEAEAEAVAAADDIRELYRRRGRPDVIIADEAQFLAPQQIDSSGSWWTLKICRCSASVCVPTSAQSSSPARRGSWSWPIPSPRSRPSAPAARKPR